MSCTASLRLVNVLVSRGTSGAMATSIVGLGEAFRTIYQRDVRARFTSHEVDTSGALPPLPNQPPLPSAAHRHEGFSHRWISSSDGLRLYTAVWRADPITSVSTACRGVIIYAHSFGSHVHDPRGFTESLLLPLSRQGYAVWGYDKRGHGRTGVSSSSFGHIGEGPARMEDLACVLDAACAAHPSVPIFLVGHGIGGSDILAFLSRNSSYADAVGGAILLAPRCDKGSFFSFPLRCLIKLESITAVDWTEVFDPRSISKNIGDGRLTDTQLEHLFQTCDQDESGTLDLGEFEIAVNRELKLGLSSEEVLETFQRFDINGDGHVSIAELVRNVSIKHPEDEYRLKKILVSNDFAWYQTAMQPSSITAPLLLIHGRHDRVNSFQAAKGFVESTASLDKSIKCFDTLRHGIAVDLDAPRVRDEVVAWLDARAASS